MGMMKMAKRKNPMMTMTYLTVRLKKVTKTRKMAKRRKKKNPKTRKWKLMPNPKSTDHLKSKSTVKPKKPLPKRVLKVLQILETRKRRRKIKRRTRTKIKTLKLPLKPEMPKLPPRTKGPKLNRKHPLKPNKRHLEKMQKRLPVEKTPKRTLKGGIQVEDLKE